MRSSILCLAMLAADIALSRSAPPQPLLPANQPAVTEAARPANGVAQDSRSAVDREVARWESRTTQAGADIQAWVNLGNALMQKSRETPAAGLYERAKTAFRKALDLDKKQTGAMLGLAWVYNSEHEFDEGRRWAKEALTINPKLHDGHALLGDAAVELGDYDDAFDHYQQALDIRPDLSTYSRAAHLLWLTGDARKARLLMQKAIDAGGPYSENTAWCRAELARMLLHEGAVLPAQQEAEKALEKTPTNHHVLAVMGQIKAARKDYAAASEFYRRAIAINPNHDALVALGDLYALTGRRDEAEKQYERVVALHTSGGGAHSHGGAAHSHLYNHGNAQLARFYADHDRNLDDALREAELACRTYKNVFVTDTLAWCYYKKGLYDQARKTIRKALHWNTPDANILFHAGMIYAKLDERTTARKHLYRALSLNPHFHPQNAALASLTLKELGEPPAGPKQKESVGRETSEELPGVND